MTVAIVTGAASGMGRACVESLRGLADVLVAADLRAPDIDGTIGVACDVADPDAVAALAAQARDLGPFRALAHAAGISPTMSDARRVLEVDLVGTELLLDAFEDQVVPGSAAVCFSSSAAYQVGPFISAEQEALVGAPLAPDFLDQAVAAVGNDSGFAYALAKVGVIRAAGRAAVRWGRRGGRVNSLAPGLIDTPMGRQEFEQQAVMQDMLPGPRWAGSASPARSRPPSPSCCPTPRRSSPASMCSSTAGCCRERPPHRSEDGPPEPQPSALIVRLVRASTMTSAASSAASSVVSDVHLGVLGRLVGRVDAGEVGELAPPGLARRGPCGRGASATSSGVSTKTSTNSPSPTSSRAMPALGPERRDERHQHDEAGVGHERGDLGDAADVLDPVGRR